MDKLLPCPFCGGEGHISSREIRYRGMNGFGAKKIRTGMQVICGKCKARGGLAVDDVIYAHGQDKTLKHMEEEAIEAWNRRDG